MNETENGLINHENPNEPIGLYIFVPPKAYVDLKAKVLKVFSLTASEADDLIGKASEYNIKDEDDAMLAIFNLIMERYKNDKIR